jgi:AcrR family transcriptional regulator
MPSKPRKAPARSVREVRPRHRVGTEQALVEAVGAVLAEEGASALSPSTVAKKAGVDKALVYRYFGTFDDLVAAYAESRSYWPTLEELVPDRAELFARPIADRFAIVLRRYVAALRARPATVDVLAAELLDRVALHPSLMSRRETLGLELLSLAHDPPPGVDVAALATVLTSSVHYLLVRARQIRVFNGVDIRSDEGWRRIEDTVELLARSALERG